MSSAVRENPTLELQMRLDAALDAAGTSIPLDVSTKLVGIHGEAERLIRASRNRGERIAAQTIKVKALLAHADAAWGRGRSARAVSELHEATQAAESLGRFDLIAIGRRLQALTASHLGRPDRAMVFARGGLDALAMTDPAMTAPIRAAVLCEMARSIALVPGKDPNRARALADEAVSIAQNLPHTRRGPIGSNYHGFNLYEGHYYRAIVAALNSDEDQYQADIEVFAPWARKAGTQASYLTSIHLEGAASKARRGEADGLLHDVEQAVKVAPTPVTANQVIRAERVIVAAGTSAHTSRHSAEARTILGDWVRGFRP
ncbi:MAG: hypothetical protein ACQSGP_11330 [Frankia sp.]